MTYITYPTAIVTISPMMNGLRLPILSERYAKMTAIMAAET